MLMCWVQREWPRSGGVGLPKGWKGWASIQDGLLGGNSPVTPPQGGRNNIEKMARFVPGLCLGSVLSRTSLTLIITFAHFSKPTQAWLLFKQNFKEVFSMLYFLWS